MSTLVADAAERYVENRLGWPLTTLRRFPKFIMIETINQCNARCIMCAIDFDSRKKSVMQPELFQKIVAQLAEHAGQVEKVMLYLDNEPLLDRQLHTKIRQVKQAGIRCVNVASNGSLLTRNRVVELIEAGLDEIYLTLDSMDQATYESIRVGLAFERTRQGILTMIEERNRLNPALRIRLQMILLDGNHQEGERFAAHWQERLGPQDEIAIQKPHNWGRQVQVMTMGDEERVNDIPCIALWGTMVVHAQGTVGLCCVDTGLTHPLGDLNRESLSTVWNGSCINEMRQLHVTGQRARLPLCNRCTLWREEKRRLQTHFGMD
ncbi:MAG: radical SAM protein [Magnetococcales bacterium]|nr:radical SAM protein [Magnetococcales bacterium]